jgi:hypothetical protein
MRIAEKKRDWHPVTNKKLLAIIRDTMLDCPDGNYTAAEVYDLASELESLRSKKSKSVNVRPDMELIYKITDQIIESAKLGKGVPASLSLTHDEIDAWRNQFDGTPIPVSLLCYRGIPIVEAP